MVLEFLAFICDSLGYQQSTDNWDYWLSVGKQKNVNAVYWKMLTKQSLLCSNPRFIFFLSPDGNSQWRPTVRVRRTFRRKWGRGTLWRPLSGPPATAPGTQPASQPWPVPPSLRPNLDTKSSCVCFIDTKSATWLWLSSVTVVLVGNWVRTLEGSDDHILFGRDRHWRRIGCFVTAHCTV